MIHFFARWRILIIFQLISGYCLAELSELKVYSPIVNKGDIGLEILGNTRFDDDENNDGFQFHELEFEYDVTNWWATSFTAGLIKEAGGSLIFDRLFHVNQEKHMSDSFKIKFSKFPDRS